MAREAYIKLIVAQEICPEDQSVHCCQRSVKLHVVLEVDKKERGSTGCP